MIRPKCQNGEVVRVVDKAVLSIMKESKKYDENKKIWVLCTIWRGGNYTYPLTQDGETCLIIVGSDHIESVPGEPRQSYLGADKIHNRALAQAAKHIDPDAWKALNDELDPLPNALWQMHWDTALRKAELAVGVYMAETMVATDVVGFEVFLRNLIEDFIHKDDEQGANTCKMLIRYLVNMNAVLIAAKQDLDEQSRILKGATEMVDMLRESVYPSGMEHQKMYIGVLKELVASFKMLLDCDTIPDEMKSRFENVKIIAESFMESLGVATGTIN